MDSTPALPGRDRARPLVSLLCLVLGIAALIAYPRVADRYYQGLGIPQGLGMTHPLPTELAQLTLFALFALAATIPLCIALSGSGLVAGLESLLRAGARRGVLLSALAALAVLGAGLLISRYTLGYAVTTDDEHTYRFIAQTLRTGHLTAPSPGQDLAFFREQFVVLTEGARFGKYTVGHPLFLALGQSLGAEHAVVPALSAALLPLLFFLARRLAGPATALLSVLLLCSSPQLLLTAATYLSQPSSALCLYAALACLLKSEDQTAARLRWLAGAGACLGYGLLVRPMPIALFAVVVVADLLRSSWRETPRERRNRLLALGTPLFAGLSCLLAVNRLQTGDALTAGFQAFHGVGSGIGGLTLEMRGADLPSAAISLLTGLFRLNLWALGWPLSLGLCFFAWRLPKAFLVWGLLVAAAVYRVVVPKAGVSATGPVYLFEVLPLVCLLVALGAVRLGTLLTRVRGVPGYRTLAGVLLAAALGNLTMFLPYRLLDLGRMGAAQRTVTTLIREQRLSHALVFHQGVVPPWSGLSWAYFPPCNPPALDGDILFMRLMDDGSGLQSNIEFWKRRFPDRSAWYFLWTQDRPPALLPLQEYAQR